MILEYVLLMVIAGLILFSGISKSSKAWKNSGPSLGARIEKNLVTGDRFKKKGARERWIHP